MIKIFLRLNFLKIVTDQENEEKISIQESDSKKPKKESYSSLPNSADKSSKQPILKYCFLRESE